MRVAHRLSSLQQCTRWKVSEWGLPRNMHQHRVIPRIRINCKSSGSLGFGKRKKVIWFFFKLIYTLGDIQFNFQTSKKDNHYTQMQNCETHTRVSLKTKEFETYRHYFHLHLALHMVFLHSTTRCKPRETILRQSCFQYYLKHKQWISGFNYQHSRESDPNLQLLLF